MADVQIAAKLSLDATGATGSVKNFKQELRLAQQEVVILTQKFGATSKEASEAAKRAAELKDAVGDAKSLVDAFNPDTKFRAFGASINTVVGGFTSLQGILGLVGVESETVQKALLNVQSALAVSQGWAQLQEGLQTFKNLGAVIKATTIFQKANAVATSLAAGAMRLLGINAATTATSFQVLKGAIVATGIGALVIGITLLVQALSNMADETDKAADAQKRLDNAITDANEAIQRQSNFIDRDSKLAVARAKARGASEEEIFAIEQSFRVKKLKATEEANAKLSDLQGITDQKTLEDIREQHLAIELSEFDFQEKQLKKREEAAAKAREQAKRLREQELKEAEEENARRLANFTAGGGPGAGLNIQIPKTIEQIQLENEAAARAQARIALAEYTAYTLETDAKFTEIKLRNHEERMAAEQAEFDAKVGLANATVGVLGALASVFGKQTAAAKVLAVAEIAAGTAVAFIQGLDIAQKSAKGTGPGAAFAFPIFYATQIAAILGAVGRAKAALGGSGPSIGGVTGLATSPPLAPQRAEQQSTTLDQASLNAIGNATSRAFVLESDIANNSERVRRLNRAAKLGG